MNFTFLPRFPDIKRPQHQVMSTAQLQIAMELPRHATIHPHQGIFHCSSVVVVVVVVVVVMVVVVVVVGAGFTATSVSVTEAHWAVVTPGIVHTVCLTWSSKFEAATVLPAVATD